MSDHLTVQQNHILIVYTQTVEHTTEDVSSEGDVLANRLRSLPVILIERNARPGEISDGRRQSLLYKPITMDELGQHLRKTYNLGKLEPPWVKLTVRTERPRVKRLRSTGEHSVNAAMQTGETIELRIRIERTYIGEATSG